jgi:ubiquinone biosynthesis protein
LLRAAIKQLLIDGFFHGDPHPGNVLVDLDTGTITYIDMGMVGQLTLYQRLNVGRLLVALQQRNARSMANVLRSLSEARREVDTAAYYADFERRISQYWMPGMYMEFQPIMNETFAILADHGLVLDTQLTLAVKFLIQLDAITTLLFPKGELIPMAVDILQEQLRDSVTAESVTDYVIKEVTHVAGEVVQHLPSLEEATLKWLDQYQKGQFSVRLDTTQLDETVGRLRSFGLQIVIGLMLVGMIIGSAIAAAAPTLTGRFWQFVPRLAVLGYSFAMIVAAFLIVRLIWQAFRPK